MSENQTEFYLQLLQKLNSPNQDEIQQTILSQIFGNTSFDKIQSECSSLAYTCQCRTIVGNGKQKIMYRCVTCQTNPNSCICEECFKNGNHEGHDYCMETLEDGHSGTCDCGSEAAWKKDGWCRNHGKQFVGDLDELIPQTFRNCFIEKMNILLDFICDQIGELYELRSTKEKITEEDQIVAVNAIQLLQKCMSIDIFYMKIMEMMKERRKQYKTRITMKSKKYETITMDELLIDTAFWDYQLLARVLKPVILDFMTGDNQSIQYSGFIFDEIVDIYSNEEVTDEMSENMIGTFVQISSNDEFNQKHFFDNEERVLSYLNQMKKMIENIIQSDFNTIGRLMAIQFLNFARHMSEILMATRNRLLQNKKYYEKMMELFELGMFFNAEFRKRDIAAEFPNKEDYKLIDSMNCITEWFYVSVDSLTQEELMYIINDMYNRYIRLYDKYVTTEKIELGITQPFSMFNHMLSCLLFAISHTENPVEIISSFPEKKKLLIYPLLFMQFGEEYPNRLWIKNTGSQIKLARHFQSDVFHHILYNYLFQLCSNDKQMILETIDEVCKLHIDIEAEETDEKKKERQIEIISGGLTSLKIIHNMLYEIIFANKLSVEEIAQYSYIVHMYFGLVQTHVYKRYVPSFVYRLKPGYDPAMELISSCVQKNGKLILNDEFKQFVNPYYPYIAPWVIDQQRDKYYQELKSFTPTIFMLERRDKQMHQNIVNILNSIEVTQMMLTYLTKFPESSLLCEVVEQLLLDRILYHDNCEYDEKHQQLLFEIGVCLAKLKGWKEAHVVKKCLQTPLEHIYKGFESIVGVDEQPKKTKALSKKEQIMMKIKQKQEAFKKEHGIEDDDEKTNENVNNDNICIICMCDENSEESPLGRMAFVHENNATQFSEYQETHDKELLGYYENGNWIKPHANDHGCWKWEPCRDKTTDLENDKVAGKIVTCCQHKVHYECYLYQQQMDKENKFENKPHLQGTTSCPLCSSFSSHFVPTQKQIELHIFDEDPIENIEETIQMTVFEMFRRSLEKELTEVEKYAIKQTIGNSLTEEETTTMNQYLHLTQLINSTIASYEIQMRENNQTKFEHILPVLHSYLSMCIKIVSTFSFEAKAALFHQLLDMRPNKNAFLQLVRIICLLPHRWNAIVSIANLREFIAIETEIFEHSSKTISIPTGTCEKKELLPQYEQYESEDELIMALAQIYLRKVHLLKQVITMKIEPLKELNNPKEYYDYPIEQYRQYHIAHKTPCMPSVVRPTLPQQFKLITLPKTHQELLSQTMKMKCCDCGKEGSEILEHCGLCLHCGALVCLNIRNDSESKTHSPSSAIDHIHKCSGKSGLILGVQSSFVVYFTGEKIMRIISNLYKTKLGDIPSSRNLYSKMEYELMEDCYDKIRKMYLNGDLISNCEFGVMNQCDM